MLEREELAAKGIEKSDLTKLIQFLDQALRPDSSWSIKDEYPQVFTEANSHNLFAVQQGGRFVSHVALKPLLVKTPHAVFKAAGIGSVVTDPQFRKQGLSRKTLEAALREAQNQSCDFAILWTSLYDFYKPMGFELAGTEVSFQWNKPVIVPTNPHWKMVQGDKVDPAALLKMYQTHTVHSVRSAEEVRQFMSIPNSQIYSLWDEKQNKILAYAVMGKGADLQGYIHEWGGKVQALVALFSEVYKTYGRPMTVISPLHSQNLIAQMESLGMPAHIGFLGMLKVLNHQRMSRKMNDLLAAHRLSAKYQFKVAGEKWSLAYQWNGKSETRELTENEVVQLIFGPRTPLEIFQRQPWCAELDRIFPVSNWIWGWDSI